LLLKVAVVWTQPRLLELKSARSISTNLRASATSLQVWAGHQNNVWLPARN